jgi:hypothetical protein
MRMRMRSRADPRRQLRASVIEFALARRRAEAVAFGMRGLTVGALLAASAGLAAQLLGLGAGPGLAGSFILVALVAAAVVGWLQPAPDLRVALEIDRRLGLGERVTTALELAARSAISPLAEQQVADAVAHLRGFRPALVYPLQVSRRSLALAAGALVLAALPWLIPWSSVPGLRTPSSQVAQVTRAEADRLESVANQLNSAPTALDLTTRQEVADRLRQAAADLRRDSGQAARASNDLVRADQAIAALSPQTGEDASLTLARISDALNNAATTRMVSAALDQQNPAGAAAAMSRIASQLGSLTPEQRNELASALQAASNAARGSDTAAAQELQQAASAVRTGDSSGVEKAAEAIRQLGQAAQAQRDVAQARSEVQASQQAISQAAQAAAPQLSTLLSLSGPAAGSGTSSSQGQSSDTGQAGGSGQSDQGSQQGGQQGGGIGTGSADHLGNPHDLEGLAQREVTVPTDQLPDSGTVGLSDQLQTGAGGTARVDYRAVLPTYRQQALQAIDGNMVPTDLKQVVKQYFDSLAAP